MSADQLDLIIQRGNVWDEGKKDNRITCADGFSLSVIAGELVYSTPRKDGGPFTHVEVGYPSQRPEPWEPVDGPDCWQHYCEDPDRPTDTVYGYVPVELVRALVRLHGGVGASQFESAGGAI